MAAKKKQYLVTNRLITWQVAGSEVTAEDGEVRDDIPADALAYFLADGAVAPIGDEAPASVAVERGAGQSEGEVKSDA